MPNYLFHFHCPNCSGTYYDSYEVAPIQALEILSRRFIPLPPELGEKLMQSAEKVRIYSCRRPYFAERGYCWYGLKEECNLSTMSEQKYPK